MIMESAEETLLKWASGEIEYDKVGIHLDELQSFFIAMPAYVGGDNKIAGFKWAAESHS